MMGKDSWESFSCLHNKSTFWVGFPLQKKCINTYQNSKRLLFCQELYTIQEDGIFLKDPKNFYTKAVNCLQKKENLQEVENYLNCFSNNNSREQWASYM